MKTLFHRALGAGLRSWRLLFYSSVGLGSLGIGFSVFYPANRRNRSPRLMPITLHSSFSADYGSPPQGRRLPSFGPGALEAILRDQMKYCMVV